MTESVNKKIWESMQERIERIRKRQAFIPEAKKLQKELLILKMQMEKVEERPFDSLYASKRQELANKLDELKQIRSAYCELAEKELSILKSNLDSIIRKIDASAVYDLDLEDHRSSLKQSLSMLKDEMSQVLEDKPRAGFYGVSGTESINLNRREENE